MVVPWSHFFLGFWRRGLRIFLALRRGFFRPRRDRFIKGRWCRFLRYSRRLREVLYLYLLLGLSICRVLLRRGVVYGIRAPVLRSYFRVRRLLHRRDVRRFLGWETLVVIQLGEARVRRFRLWFRRRYRYLLEAWVAVRYGGGSLRWRWPRRWRSCRCIWCSPFRSRWRLLTRRNRTVLGLSKWLRCIRFYLVCHVRVR